MIPFDNGHRSSGLQDSLHIDQRLLRFREVLQNETNKHVVKVVCCKWGD